VLRLALRNVFRHRLRTGLALCAIAFGVVSLILTGGFIRDMYYQLGEALIRSQSGHLQIAREGFFAQGTRSPEKYLIAETAALRAKAQALPEVEELLPRMQFAGLLTSGRSDWPVIVEGVEPEKEARLGTQVQVVNGRQLAAGDSYRALIGEGVAQGLKLSVGEVVTLLVNTAEGALNTVDLEVVGIARSFSQDYDSRVLRLPLPAAQETLASEGINTLVVSLRRTADTDRVLRQLTQALAGADLEVKTWRQLNPFYESTVALYDRQFGVLQLVILVLVVLSVANSINMSVFERVGEFGTMMALGNRSGLVFRLIMTETAWLGVIGATLGLALGVVLAALISAIGIPMPPPPNSAVGYLARIRIEAPTLLAAWAVGAVATVLAALLPARRVSRTPIAHALAQSH
jgi:putative ABC transport system permease protein